MAGIKDGLAKVDTYVENDQHGYEMGSRTWSVGTDCSGLVLYFVAIVMGIDPNVLAARYPDWSTRTMRKYLIELGWKCVKFTRGAVKEGCILLREIPGKVGHTVICKNYSRIYGAEGNWDGKRGDSSGTEVCERSYYDYEWNYIFNWDEVEDDMTSEQAAQLKFIYEHLQWDDKTHFSDMGNLVAQMPITYGSGNGKTTAKLGDRLAYIDAHTHTVDSELKKINEKLDKLLNGK